MSALRPPPKADDILTFLPGIGDAEYELRSKIRSMRNVAGAMIAKTECGTARQLAWIASDYASELVSSPAEHGLLADVGKLCQRLMITAMHAERLDAGIWVHGTGEAHHGL